MRRSLRFGGVALGAAVFFALLETSGTGLSRILEGRPPSWMALVHRIAPVWLTFAAATPWCAFMARRFPMRGGRILMSLAAHAAGGIVFAVLHTLLLIGLYMAFGHLLGLAHQPGALYLHPIYVAMEMSVYGGIVVVMMLLDARREASERALAAARLAQSLTTARLESLQAQIRPHFLFNTLNALAVLARKGDGAAVDRAIGDLGELLRASFDSPGRHEIPLGEELAFLERYLHLQRIRFPDRLEVTWQVDDDARNALVPALLVQPLVENALEHGLATARGGHVRVAARRDGDSLVLEVSDDGPGFRDVPGPGADGVGLANTRERLTLLYGPRGTLDCGERPGGGGLVRIRLPWRVTGAAESPA
jgi:hypothetical protein